MELIEAILSAIQDMPVWMRFIIIGLLLVVVVAPYVIGYINSREARRAQHIADAQKKEYDKQMEELRNEAARERGASETIKLLIENNQTTMERLAVSIDKLDERNADRDRRLEVAINNQTTAVTAQTSTLSDLIRETKQIGLTTQNTHNRVTVSSEQTHNDLAKLHAVLEALNGTVTVMKDAIIERLQAIDDRMADEHSRMFNKVQAIADIQKTISRVQQQVTRLESLDDTIPFDDTGDSSEDEPTNGNDDKKDKRIA